MDTGLLRLLPPKDYGGALLDVWCKGSVNNSGGGGNALGVRPVVSLNSGITVNAEEAE